MRANKGAAGLYTADVTSRPGPRMHAAASPAGGGRSPPRRRDLPGAGAQPSAAEGGGHGASAWPGGGLAGPGAPRPAWRRGVRRPGVWWGAWAAINEHDLIFPARKGELRRAALPSLSVGFSVGRRGSPSSRFSAGVPEGAAASVVWKQNHSQWGQVNFGEVSVQEVNPVQLKRSQGSLMYVHPFLGDLNWNKCSLKWNVLLATQSFALVQLAQFLNCIWSSIAGILLTKPQLKS